MTRAINEASLSRLPARIGRYEIIGHLAAGGMAEILLARVVGESGFARAVVVKRALDHLARQPEFEAMFLDEARLVSGIHHPNVVQVFDLGRDGSELYLVMEYLEGESAAGLMRRLAVLREKLEPALAAHIVAEVCAGLHAAHELRDANGTPVNLVHRDVNPNNVFIGYDGSVKLLDFGVAMAADRISHTEAGQIKGKYAYMSPEQCRGKPLDRRSDIFALGVTLYEISSGCRLFARPSEMLVFRAICKERVPALTEARSDAPAPLAKVCTKALERQREQRYATALDMRRDLLKIVTATPSEEAAGERLATLMQRAFSDRIEEKSELMRRVKSGSTLTSIPPAESDLGMELPTAVTSFGAETTDGGSLTPTPPRRLRSLLFALPIAGALALVAFVIRGRNPDPASANASVVSNPLPSAVSAPVESALGRPEARSVLIRIATEPTAARVSIDGKPRGTSPVSAPFPESARKVDVVIEADGFVTRKEEVVLDRDQELSFPLARVQTVRGRESARTSTSSTPAAPTATSTKGYYRF